MVHKYRDYVILYNLNSVFHEKTGILLLKVSKLLMLKLL